MKMMQRNLDGIYFRLLRNGEWKSVCVSDMTDRERQECLSGWSEDQLLRVIQHLANSLRELGDEFDIVGE